MKKIIFALIVSMMFGACSKDPVLVNSDNPRVYISRSGLIQNNVWNHDSGEYAINLEVYCSGLRPNSIKEDIRVGYKIDPVLIADYNKSQSSNYKMLPAKYYRIDAKEVIIPAGKSSGVLPIVLLVKQIIADGIDLNHGEYIIPFKLESTSMFRLQDNADMLKALYAFKMISPEFYFYLNRDKTTPERVGMRVLYGKEAVQQLIIASDGIPTDQDYTLTVDVDNSILPDDGSALPAEAYRIDNNAVIIKKGSTNAKFTVAIKGDKIPFRETFYLPLTISKSSKYAPSPTRKSIFLKIDVKNDYEWSYISRLSIQSDSYSFTKTYQETKTPVSYDKDIITIPILSNENAVDLNKTSNVIAMSLYKKFFRIKIIPTSDKRSYKVEMIKIVGEGAMDSPATIELTPDKTSYYDWDYETFYLYYRYKDKWGEWVNIEDRLEAQF